MSRKRAHRIIVILREHVGDIVNSTPYLRAIQAKFPEAKIVVDVGEAAAGVLENFPGLEEVWLRKTHEGLEGKARFVGRMRRGRFNMAIILDDSNRFVLETRLAGIPFRAGVYRSRFQKLFTVHVPYSRQRHDLFDPLNDLMQALETPVVNPQPILFPNEEDEELAESIIDQLRLEGKKVVGLNASTGRAYNRWPAERWAEIASWLHGQGFQLALFGTDKDAAFNEEIIRDSNGNPLDLAGRLSLVQVYALCRRLDAMITIDTGTVHIAAAASTPTVVLYGPTDPKRFYPFGDRWIPVRAEDAKMASNTVEDVKEAFGRLAERFL